MGPAYGAPITNVEMLGFFSHNWKVSKKRKVKERQQNNQHVYGQIDHLRNLSVDTDDTGSTRMRTAI